MANKAAKEGPDDPKLVHELIFILLYIVVDTYHILRVEYVC